MARSKHDADLYLDVYLTPGGVSELQQIRRRLAKRANQRAVRLEREVSNITGERYNQFGAISDIYKYLNDIGRSRFSEQLNYSDDLDLLQEEVVVLQKFLTRKTSTVSGMRDIERKRLETFSSGVWGSAKDGGPVRRALEFADTKEFYDFLNSETFRSLVSSGFTSEQVIERYDEARVKQKADVVADAMAEALNKFRRKENPVKVSLKNLKTQMGIFFDKENKKKKRGVKHAKS